MNIAFFGSSLVSAWWNGAATYYRGLLRALHGRGHRITFFEPDAYDRQAHRDIPDPPWAEVVVYSADGTRELDRALAQALDADLAELDPARARAIGQAALRRVLAEHTYDRRAAQVEAALREAA